MQDWVSFQKRKWEFQHQQRMHRSKRLRSSNFGKGTSGRGEIVRSGPSGNTLGGFLKRTQRTLLDVPWQIIQVLILLVLFKLIK